MAMSRSFGGTSLIRRSPMYISPLEISSRPATMRRVVDLPQPEGPTKTINSRSAISKLKSVTEYFSALSYFLYTCRKAISTISLYLFLCLIILFAKFIFARNLFIDILNINESLLHLNVNMYKEHLSELCKMLKSLFKHRKNCRICLS